MLFQFLMLMDIWEKYYQVKNLNLIKEEYLEHGYKCMIVKVVRTAYI